MRRRVLLASLVALLVGVAVYASDQLRFPARSVALDGTPVTLRVQDAVDDRSLRLVTAGILAMDRYLDAAVGAGRRRPVEARVAGSNPCVPFARIVGYTSAGVADHDSLCVDTGVVSWASSVSGNGIQAKLLAAHEYAHTWQSENGCFFEEDDHTHLWLFEGTATYLSWQALLRSGAATRADLAENQRFYKTADGAFPALRSYERRGANADTSDRLYARWHLAVRRLAAGAEDGDRSLLRFCRLVGDKREWHRAFDDAFGTSVSEFYATFDHS